MNDDSHQITKLIDHDEFKYDTQPKGDPKWNL